MDFHDYVINYPSQNDKNIQIKTSLRQEFYEMRGTATEKIPKQGEFFKHQNLFMRYVRQYDRILNIHETGTGKTGSIINVAESFHDKPDGIKQVVVIEPGGPTLEDFRSQIVKFFPEKYDDKFATNEFSRKRSIKSKLSQWYILDTYESFSNKLGKMSLIEIEEIYSDTIFFLDEAHRMRNYGENGEDENIYKNFWKLLHITKRSKIIIGTATPLINSVNDFVPLMNLILPAKEQLPINKWDYSKVSINQLEPSFRGKISFVRSLDSGIKINYNGEKIDYQHEYKISLDSEIKIPLIEKQIDENGNIIELQDPKQINNKLDEKTFQSDTDMKIIEMKNNNNKTLQYNSYTQARVSKQSFELASRESSTFTFPDGSWGIKGFNKYIEEKDNIFKFKDNGIKDFIKKNGLKELSCKFDFFITNELEASKKDKPGNSFCYLEFVKGSGVILLGLIMELYGFKNYTKVSSCFVRSNGIKKLNPNFKPAKRFALITSRTTNVESLLELFNSAENADGKYLQSIIVSKIARDGINLANVLRGYIISPGWHESGMYQALSRFIRATSHRLLLERGEDVNIDIYKLAACLEKNNENDSLENIKNNSVDIFNYLQSESKDLQNRVILRDMKNIAFDAILNYERNHRPTDVNFTKQTDYGGKYPDVWANRDEQNDKYLVDGYSIDETFLQRNTKKLLYYQKVIDQLDILVRRNIKNYDSITLEELIRYSEKSNFESYYVFLYISNYMKKIKIEDKFGNKRKLIQDGNVFFLDLSTHHFTSSKPNKLPIIEDTEIKLLGDFYNTISGMDKENIMKYIRNIIWKVDLKNKPLITETTSGQNYMIDILEDCIIARRNGTSNDMKNIIYDLFKIYIGKSDFPRKEIDNVKEAYENSSSKAGRVAKKYSKTKINKLMFSKKDTGKDTVYYHFFNIVVETNNVANIFKREDNKVRILKPGSDKFVNADVNELPIFQSYYVKDLDSAIGYYQREIENGISSYGTLFRDNKFRIISPPFTKSRGTVCGTNKDIPYEILSNIHLNGENLDMLRKIMPDEITELNSVLEMELDTINDKLYPESFDNINTARRTYFWKGILKKPAKTICNYLENYFKFNNKLMATF